MGVASGALQDDFDIMHVPMDGLAARFRDALTELAGMLDGTAPGGLADDPAIAACKEHPIPVVSAAMGFTAVRRAAALGTGVVFDSLSTPERCRDLIDAYREAGGTGSCILIRRAWVGEPPRARVDDQVDVYRGYSATSAMQHWGTDELVGSPDGAAVAGQLNDVVQRTGADALNLRVHVPGVSPNDAREQIARLGHEVLGKIRGVAP